MDFELEKQKVHGIIAGSEQIGLLLPAHPTIDCIAATEVIARMLSADNRHVGFFPGVAEDAIATPEAFAHVRNPRPLIREFIIAIDTAQSPIGQLRYEKHEDRVEVILSPKNTKLRQDALSFGEGKVQCDCVIAVGVADIEASSPGELGLTPQFFTETPIIAIGNAANQKNYGEVNFISRAETSLCELAYEFLKAADMGTLDAQSATLLLAGIMNDTRNFQSPVRVGTHLVAAELLRAEADHAKAAALAQVEQPFSLLQLIARASVRSKEGGGGRILWSFLTAEDFEKTGRRAADTPAVMEALQSFFSPHTAEVLLWQDLGTHQIRAMLRGEHSLLATLAEKQSGELHNPIFTMDAAFSNFLEAEERITSLLREAL